MAQALSKAEQVARAMEGQQMKRNRWLSLPAVIFIMVFGVLPLVLMFIYSFLTAAPYGGVEWVFTTKAYVYFLFQEDIFDGTLQFAPDFLIIYLRSLIFALITTAVCLIVGFPTAYFMATRPCRSATGGSCSSPFPSGRTFWCGRWPSCSSSATRACSTAS